MTEYLRWFKGTDHEPGVSHLSFDAHRTLCLDVLRVPPPRGSALGVVPLSACRACQAEAERLLLPTR